eukprot:6214118-Pleurochrysis_carterae.AAC.5
MVISRDLPRATVRAGKEMVINLRYQLLMVWERARARGLGAPTGVAPYDGAQRAAAAMRERGFQSLGSGARALRKYVCDATAAWETEHVNVKPQGKSTVSGVEPHERA